jgi:hypothetical protein
MGKRQIPKPWKQRRTDKKRTREKELQSRAKKKAQRQAAKKEVVQFMGTYLGTQEEANFSRLMFTDTCTTPGKGVIWDMETLAEAMKPKNPEARKYYEELLQEKRQRLQQIRLADRLQKKVKLLQLIVAVAFLVGAAIAAYIATLVFSW